MAIPASLFAMMLPGSNSLVAVLLRAAIFAPIGAICALIVWTLRRGRALSPIQRITFVAVAALSGAGLGVVLDLGLTVLRPEFTGGISGGDVALGSLTGALASYMGVLRPSSQRLR